MEQNNNKKVNLGEAILSLIPSSFKWLDDIKQLISAEARLAFESINILFFIYIFLGILLISIWIVSSIMIVIAIMSLKLNLLSALGVLSIIYLTLILIMLRLKKVIAKNIFFPATRRQLAMSNLPEESNHEHAKKES